MAFHSAALPAGKYPETLIKPGCELDGSKRRHPGGCELDRQWDPIEPPRDLCDSVSVRRVEFEIRLHALGALDEQAHGIATADCFEVGASFGDGQPPGQGTAGRSCQNPAHRFSNQGQQGERTALLPSC
jgi:hypothetical protein